jgi:hypothetical protein
MLPLSTSSVIKTPIDGQGVKVTFLTPTLATFRFGATEAGTKTKKWGAFFIFHELLSL